MRSAASGTSSIGNFGKAFLAGIFLFTCAFLFGAPQSAHAQGKTIMVIAPHPDDEALCCAGIIYAAKQAGNTVKVVVVTNGDDYESPANQSRGYTREAETVAAMTGLGLSTSDVIFFGYGDQSLQQLLYASSATKVYTSAAGQTKTYANTGLGGVSYHQYLTGSAGSYTQQTVLGDFESALKNFAPTDIYTTGFWDNHPDHRSTYGFAAQALIALKKQGLLPNTKIHETWIHAPCQDCDSSYYWPDPQFSPSQPFPIPEYISETPYDWTQIENVPVPAAMQDPNQNTNLKWNTIAAYPSQTGNDPSSYLFDFVKIGEFFWVRNFQTNVAVLATATASSQTTTNLQAASNAIDGIIAGVPNPLSDSGNETSFSVTGGGEWVTQGQLAGAWIKLTWPSSVTTSEVILYGRPDGTDNVLSGTLTFSDGSSVPVGALPVGGAGFPITFPSKTITWMQFTVNSAQGQNIGLAEIEVFGALTSSTNSFSPQMTDGPVANQSTITPSQPTPLTTSSFDIYGYPLTYSWTANGGTITGTGTSVTYNPPGAAGTYTGTVTVTDGHGGSTQNSTFVTVTCGLCGTISGPGGNGAKVALTGAASASTTATPSGAFDFEGLSNGNYTVTPSLAGYTFSPVSKSVTVSGGTGSANFTSTALTYSLSGSINGVAGATVTLTSGGSTVATLTSGASGVQFVFPNLTNGVTYTVTPSLAGYTFSPTSASVTINAGNATLSAFTATLVPTFTVSGTVSGVTGATLTLTSGSSTIGTTTSNSSGAYSFSNVTNGTYTVTPSLTGYSFSPTSASVTVNGANATVSTFTATSGAPGFTPIRINAGGPAYTDSLGNPWSADADFSGGSTASTTSTVTGTSDPTLYKTERYGALTYTFTVPAGSYAVTLKFAEIYWTSAGQRIFSVSLNGTTVLSNFDVVATAGAPLKALDETFNTTASSGKITVQLITGSQDLPKISAIQIVAATAVAVQVSPTTSTLTAGQQQQFTATVTGNSNTAVTWTMNPQVGTLSNSGLYTAPATITSTQTVTVTATSQADTTKSASSTVTLNPLAIQLVPGTASLTANQQQQFTATVTGNPNTSVTWTMNPQVGTLNTSGLYTAPASISSTQTVTVTATSQADATKSASSTVTLNSLTVQLTPGATSLTASQQQQFAATVTGNSNTAVTWTMNPQAGTLSSAGMYTAPAAVSTSQAVTVTATSAADTTKSASSTVTLNPPSGVTVQLTPTTTSLSGGQQQQFTATVGGNSNTAVTWSMNPQVGTLSLAGLYSAPPTISTKQTITVSATSAANTSVSASATVTLNPPAPAFTPIRVNTGGAAYTDSQGNPWSADTGYSGGSAASTTSTISGTSDPTLYQTERYGAMTYTFSVPAGSYAVTLKFAEIYYTAAGQRIFNVAINGTPVLTNFDIVAQAGAAFKALDETFNVSASTGSIAIQFTTGSQDLPKVSAIQILSASGVGITLAPTTTSLSVSQQQQFTPTVTGTSNTSVTWTMNPQVGTLSTAGLYTAPATITATQTVTVTATSVADTTKSANATVTLNPPAGSFTPIRVDTGGTAYTDSQGNPWSADTGFSSGSTSSTTSTITGTSDPTLYQTERYGAMTYTFSVPAGSYAVTLKFAEIYYTAAGQRIFNVAINGTSVLSNFDIVAQAGAAFKALDKTFTVTPSTGSIAIQFTTGSQDLPKISAIQIVSTSGVAIQVSPSSASLTGGQQQQFTATVTGNSNTSATWAMNPQVGTLSSSGLYTAPATITSTQVILVTATSVADTTKSATSTVTLNPPAGSFTPIRVNGGGPAYTDSLGNLWSADTGFTGGSTASTTASIAKTSDSTLYQTERYGNLTYNFTVPNGSHTVTLKFAEIYYTTTGQRIFNVAINGAAVLSNFDIVAAAGGADTAFDQTFPVTVTNGAVSIVFTQGTADLPKISAIQIQ